MSKAGGIIAIGPIRMAIGLGQGLLLHLLKHAMDGKAWPATMPNLFGALMLFAVFAPVILLASLGQLRRLTLTLWTAGAAALLLGLGAYDAFRNARLEITFWPSPALYPLVAAGLFIAHHLIAGSDVDKRRLARYPTYFDIAWMHGVQLVLSVAFVGAFWLILLLGAALFKVIGIDAIETLIQKTWFAFPVTGLTFATAVHLTDVKPGLVRGIRTIALNLLSWLLPIMALIAAGFVAALPFTGLKLLFETGSATASLLGAAATLIILINATYEDGEPDAPRPEPLKWAGRVAAVLLTPIIGVAGYALALRIGQYGLSVDRIIALACVIVGAAYALGYLAAAIELKAWMKRLELVNVSAAYLILLTLLCLMTPIADPVRLSVADQVRRLEAGKVDAKAFDYAFLRFHGARYGRRALEHLAKSRHVEVAANASQALKLRDSDRYRDNIVRHEPDVFPAGRVLPRAFMDMNPDEWRVCSTDASCNAIFMDINADGAEEIVLSNRFQFEVFGLKEGRWRQVGSLGPHCTENLEAMKRGAFKPIEPEWKDVEIDGRRLAFSPNIGNCPEPQ